MFSIKKLFLLAWVLTPLMWSLTAEAWTFARDSENIYHMMRENNPQYWGRSYLEKSPELEIFLSYEGLVWGDAHLQNFSLRHWKGENFFIYDDFDDSGEGSYFLDFLRLYISAQIFHLDQPALYDSYLKGLTGEDALFLKNDFLSELKSLSGSQLREAEQDYLNSVTRVTSSGRRQLHSKSLDFSPVSKQRIQSFESLTGFKVVDAGQYVRDRGGSYGTERIWFLTLDEAGDYLVYELKEVFSPSVDYYKIQPFSDLERLSRVIEQSWPSQLHDYYQSVEFEGRSFLLRARVADLTAFFRERYNTRHPKRTDIFAQRAAYEMGRFHASQENFDSTYTDLLISQRENAMELLSEQGHDYLRDAQSAMSDILEGEQGVRVFGGFRYRLQRRQEQGKESRAFQHKIRVRLGAESSFHKNWSARVMLETNDDPRSPNIDLEDFFESKPIYIAHAYGAYHSKTPDAELEVQVGKTPKPFITVGSSELIWDTSINPEGLSLLYDRNMQFFRLGAYLLDEEYSNSNGENRRDTNMFALQWGVDVKTLLWRWRLGLGATLFQNIKGLDVDDTWEKESEGNTLNNDDEYQYDYHLVEAFGDVVYRLPRDFEVGLFIHLLNNRAAPSGDNAYRFGLQMGWKDFDFYHARTRVGPDAAFGAITDSTAGEGGTSYRASDWRLTYKINSQVDLTIRHIFARADLNKKEKFRKSRLELNFSF